MKASAYVVGPLDGSGAGLMEMARKINFASVMPYAGILQAEQQVVRTPLCFFLFAAVTDVGKLRGIAQSIRFSARRQLRFSPLIYFSESPSNDTIERCIGMGFDDVITMPFARNRMQARIDRQIGRTLTYFETTDYFGPDRRLRPAMQSIGADARVGGQFRRIEIIRNAATGVNVLRDEFVTPRISLAATAA
jgi:CheY-like chemotaxis protein